MRVLIVSREPIFPILGGSSLRVMKVAKNLINEGNEVSFILPSNTDIDAMKTYFPNSDVFLAKTSISRFSKRKIFDSFLFGINSSKLIRTIYKNDIDVIFGHSSPVAFGALLSRTEIPTIVDIFEVDLPEIYFNNLHAKYFGIFSEQIVERILKRMDAIVVLTEVMKKFLQNKNIETDVVAYDGADTNLFKPSENHDNKVIIFHGGIEKRDGLIYAIKAMGILREYPELHMEIIGYGKEVNRLKLLTKKMKLNNVTFKGWMDFEQIPDKISRAFLAVVPSTNSLVNNVVIPRKIFEYMACGVPVITSELDAIKEVIQHKKTGIFIETENEYSIAEGVRALLSDEKLHKKISKNGRKVAIKHDVKKEVSKIVKEIERLGTMK